VKGLTANSWRKRHSIALHIHPRTKLRTVIRNKRFEKELSKIEPQFERADEFMFGVEWRLARDPLSGSKIVSHPPVYCVHSKSSHWIYPVTVFYTFTEDEVTLLLIIKSPQEPRL
jgi:hypothetical protein